MTHLDPAVIGTVATAAVSIAKLYFQNRQHTRALGDVSKKVTEVSEKVEPTANGYAGDVMEKLTSIEQKVDDNNTRLTAVEATVDELKKKP